LDLQSSRLHAEIRAERLYARQKDLSEQANVVDTHLSHVQAEIAKLNEVAVTPKLRLLIRQNIHALKVSINGKRVEIPKNLELTVTFEGCSHSLRMPVYELLGYQSSITSRRQLLATWQANIQNNFPTTRVITCMQCHKEQADLLAKLHIRHGNARIGRAKIQIVIFK
jgi:hypothetical protein